MGNVSRAGPEVKQGDDGKWQCDGLRFGSEEAARMYAESRGTSGKQAKATSQSPGGPVLAVTAIVLGCMFLAVSCSSGKGDSSARAVSSFDRADALVKCQQAIKMLSKDAEKADVPYVPDQGGVSGYFFAWNNTTKLARLRNGLGLEVGVTAMCKVDKVSKQITLLTIDGQQLI